MHSPVFCGPTLHFKRMTGLVATAVIELGPLCRNVDVASSFETRQRPDHLLLSREAIHISIDCAVRPEWTSSLQGQFSAHRSTNSFPRAIPLGSPRVCWCRKGLGCFGCRLATMRAVAVVELPAALFDSIFHVPATSKVHPSAPPVHHHRSALFSTALKIAVGPRVWLESRSSPLGRPGSFM